MLPPTYVLIVEPSLSVKKVDRQVEMGELEVNSDDSDNESYNRFEVPAECDKAIYAPLMHDREKAIQWDRRRSAMPNSITFHRHVWT